jgi:NADH-quinone oxidoreductase subunit N
MAIFMLSLAGLPPLVGFFGKFYLFTAALQVENFGLLWLVVLGLAGSLVSLYYYLTVLKIVFLEEETPSELSGARDRSKARGAEICVALLAMLVLLLGVLPSAILSRIIAALP